MTSLDPPTPLDGEWRCLTGDDPAWARPGADLSAATVVSLPDTEKRCHPAPAGERRAVAWLLRELRVAPELRGAALGLSMGEIRGAAEVFVDGQRIGTRGSLEPFKDDLRRGVAHAIPPALAEDGLLHVAVRVVQHADVAASPQGPSILPDGPLWLGRMPTVDALAFHKVDDRVRAETSFSLAFAALLLIVGLYHVLVWLMRRQLQGYLWFAVFVVLANAWIAMITLASTPTIPLSLYDNGVYSNLIGTLTNLFFVDFFWHYLFDKPPDRKWRLTQAVLLVIAFIGFVPVYGYALTVNPLLAIPKIAIFPWALFLFIRAARRGERKREARYLIAGLIAATLLAPVAALEVLYEVELPFHAAQVAIGAFTVVMALALVIQFTGTLGTVEALNASIARFVPYGFLHALGRDSVKDVERGDARGAEMVVMFCDIRGFTPLTEKLGPEGTITMLNEYLARMEPAIHAGGGFVNQYYGDGLMVLFPEDPAGAVNAVRGMFRNLDELNEKRTARGDDPIRIGVALHTGPLMIGTIGGGERLDSGVIGDVVNSTARLEGMTKIYGARALLSGELMARLGEDAPATRVVDVVLAKGKNKPLELHQLLEVEPDAPALEPYADAFEKYRAGEFAAARDAFSAIENDGAAAELAARCETLNAAPPEGWDGVFALQRK